MQLLKFATITACFIVATCLPASAEEEFRLPRKLVWSTYVNGSTAHSQVEAIRNAIGSVSRTWLYIVTGTDDITRAQPLRNGHAHFSATGLGGSFVAQEGVHSFSAKRWGPQPVRLVLANNAQLTGLALAVAGDICDGPDDNPCAGFEYADLKGKRVAWIKNAPILNTNTTAYLAYAGLGWEDVARVEFGSFSKAWQGMLDNQVDAAFAATNSARAYELAKNKRGIHWPAVDPGNEAGLERMRQFAPHLSPTRARYGAGIDNGPALATAGHGYPVLIAMQKQSADVVYNMIKAIEETYDKYKDKTPGIGGWQPGRQQLTWVVPYHEGAIRYFRETGQWTIEAQRHNARLIKRQEVLQRTWQAFKEIRPRPKNWQDTWTIGRETALKAAGFDVVF